MSASTNDYSVTVLGSGTMGAQIALSLATGGVAVTLWGRQAANINRAIERIATAFDFLVASELEKPDIKDAVLARIQVQPDLSTAVDGRTFIIEAVIEELAVKQALLTEAEQYASDSAILSSTTSALSATAIQSCLRRPARFCIAHYAQPAHLVKLVEVVPGRQSSESAVDYTTQLLHITHKTPVLCPDIPGFLWARIQHAVLREFSSLVGQGLVSAEACDTVLKQGYAARLPAMGAFEHADLAGLDLLNGAAAKAVWADLSNVNDPADTPVGQLFSEGHTGMQSGQGFYNWQERNADEFKQARDEEIVRRVKIQAGAKVVMS